MNNEATITSPMAPLGYKETGIDGSAPTKTAKYDGETPAPSGGPLRSIVETTPVERVAGTVAVASVGSSIAAMIVEQTAVVLIAGSLSCIVGPYMYFQQTRLTDIKALKETHVAVQREVDILASENGRLKVIVADLSESLERLEHVEQAFEAVTQTQNNSISAFAEQVQQSREILQKMKLSHRDEVLQNIIEVIIRSDLDGNNDLNDKEVDTLMKRLRQINGVQVNEGKFQAAIKGGGRSLHAVMDVVKELVNEDVAEKDATFFITE